MKALVCAAALAAGLATAAAQNVYSLNVVGYYNVACPAGQYVMVANQLNTTNNTLGSLIPIAPAGAEFLKWAGGWTGYTFDDIDMEWKPDGNASFNPGEAALFRSPDATTLTFVGEVLQGNLSTGLTPQDAYIARASMVPQAGLLSTDLGFPGEPGDEALKWAGGWTGYTFDDLDLEWKPSEPTFAVGEGLLIKKAAGGSTAWTRNFTVQ